MSVRFYHCFICLKPCPPGRMTCSDTCHEAFIRQKEKEYGGYKKVVDMVTGKTHRVPTRHIIEKGLNQTELKNFPEWESSEKEVL